MAKNWIKGALSKPGSRGALHRELNVPEGQKIPKAKVEKAAHSTNPVLAQRARLAETLGKLRK